MRWSMRPTGEAGKLSRRPCMKSRIFENFMKNWSWWTFWQSNSMKFLRWREFHCLAVPRRFVIWLVERYVLLLFLIRIIPCPGRFCGAVCVIGALRLVLVFRKRLYFPRRDAIQACWCGGFRNYVSTVCVARHTFLFTGLMVFAWSQFGPPFSLGENTIPKIEFSTWFYGCHRVCFRSMKPMVWRTCTFWFANNHMKTHWFLSIRFCGVLAATKWSFSAQDSCSISTMCFLLGV